MTAQDLHRLTACAVLTLAMLAWPATADAQLGNLTNSALADITVVEDGGDFALSLDGDFSNTGGPVSASGGASFGGDETGIFAISGSATAWAGFGQLQASAFTTITENTVSDFDRPYILPDGSTDPEGVPWNVGFQGIAEFQDRLQYGGTATAYTSRYLLRLTGTISGQRGFAAVILNHGGGPASEFFFDGPGTYDELLVSETYVHGGSPQFFSVTLQTSADLFPEYDGEGFSSSVAFGNTLELLAVELRDADTGELLLNETVTAESGGGSVPIQIVPEPGTAAITAVGGLMLLGYRRRRGQNKGAPSK